MPSEIDYARLAAFIDGEGCIDIHKHKQFRKHLGRDYVRLYLRLTIVNTDPRLSAWCKSIFEGCDYQKRKDWHPRWADSTEWIISAQKAAEILRHCLPYFILKREQAEAALRFQESVDTKHNTGRGGLAPEIFEFREKCAIELKRLKRINKPLALREVTHVSFG